jgi:uncharacterized repeat protein (TIGR03803 family)
MKKKSAGICGTGVIWELCAPALAVVIAMGMLLPLASQVCAAQDVSLLHSFTGGSDGSYPDGNLSEDAAGNLYGTTQIGGAYGAGTVFELSPKANGKWHFLLLYTSTGADDGGYPLGSVVFDAAGNAYVTASGGGADGLGAVVELSRPTPADSGQPWNEKVLYSFQGGNDGALPFGDVVFDAAGDLYGTTSIGGRPHIGCPPAKGCGTIYELSPVSGGAWKERVIHKLSDAFGQGAEPRAGLVMDAAGNLYGTTYEGGDNLACNGYGCGSVFELVRPPKGKHWGYKTLVDFNESNGALPRGGLTLDGAGSLWGTTTYGGVNNSGIVFSFTEQSGRWTFSDEYNFDGIDGLQPSGNVAFDGAGNLYGAAYQGGESDSGAVFQLIPNGGEWTENVLYDFALTGKKFGENPLGGVMVDSAGDVYMTTNQGGDLRDCAPNPGCGTVIKVSGAQ